MEEFAFVELAREVLGKGVNEINNLLKALCEIGGQEFKPILVLDSVG
ncbi:MAG: hypothetical protein JRJ23_05610 [Deltaproteobacteria bacterium]|nr:hypothetical protein [Deltaproteobacteria bacterium]